MDMNVLGPALFFALFLTGISIGWRAARLNKGEASIPTRGFGRGAPKPLRVAVVGFGVLLSALPLVFLSDRIQSLALAYVAVMIVALGLGIGWGAIMRGWFTRAMSSWN
jgi:divalent metal cation (Fe/Co/Zn/Cd) transporter